MDKPWTAHGQETKQALGAGMSRSHVTGPLDRADDGIRTRDPHLGKVVLYQLSHVRVTQVYQGPYRPVEPNPPLPRADSGSSETSTRSTWTNGTKTSWAMRSPRRISTACSGSRFTTDTMISPR